MKIITSLTVDGTVYKLNAEIEGHVVKHISFKRDGLVGINKGTADEAHYIVVMENRMTEKEVFFKMLPASAMDELTYIEVEKEDPDDGKVNMKRVQQ